jgi:hypothetical protein
MPQGLRLAVKFQPVDDLVDHIAFGVHRYPDQIERGAATTLSARLFEVTPPAAGRRFRSSVGETH